ncbi:BTB/POZ domain-containing protein At3g05675 [Cryptomeria japonica]|uniref:BTB/POZ domain-containing protein At3g05675 n=1 Tax=Cryptomeria japonica TaxID=3369 RepID=UPI0025ABA3B4|nr:BTB/POZ domain-containing protein At3g05675 [Cryptomeria japonica]
MDAHSFEIGEKNDGDVILRIICANGVEFKGNPLYLHSHVLGSKSNFFQARLSEQWSLHMWSLMSPLEIKITVIPNGLAENYIKCIRFIYLSYKGKSNHFFGVDEALDIFPIASQLLFEEGIQACVHYLEAVPWTRQQSVKINSLQSNLQVSISADLSARLEISNSLTAEKIELFKKKLPQMLSDIGKNQIPISMSRLIMEKQLSEIFQGNACPAVEEVCRDAIINEFSLKIDRVKNVPVASRHY